VLGPDKLPQVARKVGQVVSEVRKVSTGFQSELQLRRRQPLVAQAITTCALAPTLLPPAAPGVAAGRSR
jgi:Sec-independent protein translocase protein TatA